MLSRLPANPVPFEAKSGAKCNFQPIPTGEGSWKALNSAR
jgi:hypothetical protein